MHFCSQLLYDAHGTQVPMLNKFPIGKQSVAMYTVKALHSPYQRSLPLLDTTNFYLLSAELLQLITVPFVC